MYQSSGPTLVSPSCSPNSSLSFDTHVENLPSYHTMIGSNINGTYKTEANSLLHSPSGLNHHLAKLRWGVIKDVLSRWAEDASQGANSQINRLFEGTDMCEIGFKVSDILFPSITLPTAHQVERTLDKLTDGLQALLVRSPPESRFEDAELQGLQWVFAVRMGEKVRRSLVKQGICSEWQAMPSRENLEWQERLNQALVSFLEQLRLGKDAQGEGLTLVGGDGKGVFPRLMEMEPMWVAELERKAWKLELDTLIVDLECKGKEVVDSAKMMATGFELPEAAGCARVEDWCRKTRTVEEEWEMLV